MTTETPEAFGALLKHSRLAAGLTQEALAGRAGISPRSIQAIEGAVNRPQSKTVVRLVAALGLTAEERARFEEAAMPTPRRRSPASSAHAVAAPSGNPFFHRGPVRDAAYFRGRDRETRFVAELLRQGQSVAINGPRRLGKTSLLFHVADPAVAQNLHVLARLSDAHMAA